MSTIVSNPPIPENELKRSIELSELNLDYSDLNNHLSDLCKLAAKVAGTKMSVINLLDHYTQWTVSRHGIKLDQVPREETICQHTIMNDKAVEFTDLRDDERFNNVSYVEDDNEVNYYYGVPLGLDSGNNIGALCILDKEEQELTPEKKELLQIIANEIVNRLKSIREVNQLKEYAKKAIEDKKKVSHDIRGPIGGIIGLAEIIKDQINEDKVEDILELMDLIHEGGISVLELADNILTKELPVDEEKPGSTEFTLETLKGKLEQLYSPQARSKNIDFKVNNLGNGTRIPFPKKKILQIVGNLISNAIKFTPEFGTVKIEQSYVKDNEEEYHLVFNISDTGVGISKEKIDTILNGNVNSENGTSGENGYGFGLSLVQHLLEGIDGKMVISSTVGSGTEFNVKIPT